MILSDEGIKAALESGAIEIDPPPSADQYTTSAVDIHLGDNTQFRIWDHARLQVPGAETHLDLSAQDYQLTAQAYMLPAPLQQDGSLLIPPYNVESRVWLCMTKERLHLKRESGIAARVEGRSSFARLGLMVHLTAPTIHSDFNAPITLECINHGPFYLKLVPHQTRICQFIFEILNSPPSMPVATGFQHQTSPEGS